MQVTLAGDAEATTAGIKVHPDSDSIIFKFFSDTELKNGSHKLYLSADSDINVTNAFFTDLRSAEQDRIPGEVFTLNPSSFELTNTTLSVITTTINLTDRYEAGVYTGHLLLLSDNSPVTSIITTIEIQDRLIESGILTIVPNPITFSFKENDLSGTKDLQVTTTRDLVNVQFNIINIESKEGDKPIPKDIFSLEPRVFDVNTREPTNVEFKMRSDGSIDPGTYEGHLQFYSGSVLETIPITITITPVPAKLGSSIFPIIFALAGIGASITLMLSREGTRLKNAVSESADKALEAYNAAFSEGRMSKGEFSSGVKRLVGGAEIFIDRSNYISAIESFEGAKENFDKANRDGEQYTVFLDPKLPKQLEAKYEKTLGITAATGRGKAGKDYLAGIAFAIVLVTVVLTVLQSVSIDILDFDDPVQDAIAAFLFGFGSQAVISQIAPIVKRESETA
jgi:hypothetical protein